MSMREWMNENSTVVTIGAVALLVVALVVLVTSTGGGGPRGSGNAWFQDLETGEIFRASAEELPPITSPDGNEAVRAYRFSCGRCTESEMFVGYYEMFTDEAKTAREEQRRMEQDASPEEMARMQQQMYGRMMTGRLISTDLENWVESVGGGAAHEVQRNAHEQCEGSANRCDP